MNDFHRPTVSVHKFSSCDGCQLAILNLGEALLDLVQQLDIRHFAEAGLLDELAPVEIALVEGSLSTPADIERIKHIREVSRFLVTIGACATAGGLQALRNLSASGEWLGQIYASPEYIASLDQVRSVREVVRVDAEIWGCPVDRKAVLQALAALSRGVLPLDEDRPLCMECKRRGLPCVAVSQGQPCLGPITRQGCGALCPGLGRGCYGCYGPAEQAEPAVLLQAAGQWRDGGLVVKENFRGFYSHIEPFKGRNERSGET